MTFDKLRMTFDRLRMTFDRLRMILWLAIDLIGGFRMILYLVINPRIGL